MRCRVVLCWLTVLGPSWLGAAAPPPAERLPPPEAHLVEGKFGKALDAARTPQAFGGDERYRTPPLTVECWARLDSRHDFNVLVSCDPKDSSRHWEIYSYRRSGAFAVYLPGNDPAEIVSKKNICDGKWHYLALTHDGTVVRLFVDGTLVREQAIRARPGLKPRPGPLSVGQAIDGSQRVGCDGRIDDVRISRVVRAIAGVPQAPLPLDAQTVALWRFDGSDRILADPAWTPPPRTIGEAWERATDADWVDARLRKMDTGPTFNATMTYTHQGKRLLVYKATAIRVGDRGEGAVLYDRSNLRLSAGWLGWLHHSDARFGLLNTPRPEGKMVFTTTPGPGWADTAGRWSSKQAPTIPLPRAWGRYEGLYLCGKRTVLACSVSGVGVRESPWLETIGGQKVLVRTIEVDPHRRNLHLLLGEGMADTKVATGQGVTAITMRRGEDVSALLVTWPALEPLPVTVNGSRVEVRLPPADRLQRFEVLAWTGPTKALAPLVKAADGRPAPAALSRWTKGGPARYPHPLVTRGEVARDDAPHIVDTLTIPYTNPHQALFFCTGLDFLPDGRLAVCTAHGDVWLVSGVDSKLDKLSWKRFATGLYQPLGLRVVDGKVVVLERGQLTRLHDLDGDGEADFYENLCNDWHTGAGEHSYDTCLETDAAGNFYFFKTGDPHLPHGGCLLRAGKDGRTVEVFATGFRHPIGLSVSPEEIVTGADQEGNWMPATRIDVYRRGGFYGDLRAHHRSTPPKTYDPPLLWLPREVDNSAGGQVWVPHDRFGLPKGQLLHLSYGRCKLFALLTQKVEGQWQAGGVDLGVFFLSGAMRGRFHPSDGHLYVCGLNGWQTAARRDGCLQRVRWTGKPVMTPTHLAFHADGIHLVFARKLDATTAQDLARWRVEQWNYHWSGNYGSPRYSVRQPGRVGQDRLEVVSASLTDDGKGVFLKVKGLGPVMQLRVGYDEKAADGKVLRGEVHGTINRLAEATKR
jgi:hypothetical protein